MHVIYSRAIWIIPVSTIYAHSVLYKCKNISTKMLKDVGMEVPTSIETRSKFSMQKQGMIACNNPNMRNPI